MFATSLAHLPLTEREIDRFIDSFNFGNDKRISFAELERRLEQVYKELRPHVESDAAQDDAEKASAEHVAKQRRRHFVQQIMGNETDAIDVDHLKQLVRQWNIPSLEQEKRTQAHDELYLGRVPLQRRVRALWKAVRPEYNFLAFVTVIQLGLGTWQCLRYALGVQYQEAFGWGVAMSKFAAGALWPTLFLLLLSMSRWSSTMMRRFTCISWLLTWDRTRTFHILMSIEVLILSTVHAIGHLSGTFNWGSKPEHQAAVSKLLGNTRPMSYKDYVLTLPGISGLLALGILYFISLMSMPAVRRRSYELFQMVHLLMYPFIGLLMCHGAARMLQYPVMGFALILPTVMIVLERFTRLVRGIWTQPAFITIVDKDTVKVTCRIPSTCMWPYEAGQYVFLQVPELSFFQWHPFTVALCTDRDIQLHIKTDGNWTSKLRKLAGAEPVQVGIDGPYGAPAQRFFDYDQTIIIGAGIGITPFSAILHDLQVRQDHRWSAAHKCKRSSRLKRHSARPAKSSTSSQLSSTTLFSSPNKSSWLLEGGRGYSQGQPSPPWTLTPSQSSSSTPRASMYVSHDNDNSMPSLTLSPSASAELHFRDPAIRPGNQQIDLQRYRRVDMHWIVRDKNHLLWFSDLMNGICLGDDHDRAHLDIRLSNHVTHKQDDISLHVFRWLLERHRIDMKDRSPLTGLVSPTHFGRPDFPTLFFQHYEDMQQLVFLDPNRSKRVGVFFCGASVIGAQLADLCHQLTSRGTRDGSRIEYHFQTEVFG